MCLFSRAIPATTPTASQGGGFAPANRRTSEPQDLRPRRADRRRKVEVADREEPGDGEHEGGQRLRPPTPAEVARRQGGQQHDRAHGEGGENPDRGRGEPEQADGPGRQERRERRLVDVSERGGGAPRR